MNKIKEITMNKLSYKNIGLDENGYILKDVSKENIKEPWKSIIDKAIIKIKEIIPYELHSIYIYGSVGRGQAELNFSDIDLIIITKNKIRNYQLKELKKVNDSFMTEYPFIRELGLEIGTFEEVMKSKNLYSWGFWLNTCCDCIYGEDLGRLFPKFKPSKMISKGLNGDIETWLATYKPLILDENNSFRKKQYCKEIMKKIARTAFSLVSEKENSWTSDIEVCSELFEKNYPSKEEEIKIVVDLAKNPIEDSNKIIEIIDRFGVWLLGEVKTVLE